MRRATGQDLLAFDNNIQKSAGAAKIFILESQKLNLDMKLLTTEYTLDSTIDRIIDYMKNLKFTDADIEYI